MKISYLLLDFGNMGGSLVLYNFMDNLTKRGYEVHAVFPDKNIKWEVGIWKEWLKKDNSILYRDFEFLKKIILPLIPKKVLKYLKEWIRKKSLKGLIENWEQSDVTISTFYLTAYAAYYLADRTVPFYHMQHFEELFVQDKEDRLMARNTYYLPIIKIANSSWLKEIMKENFHEKTYLVKPGIDRTIFTPSENPENKYKNKKEWSILSYLDEKREWKGFDDAVNAVKIARENLQKKGIKLNWKVFGINPPSKKYDTEFEYIGAIFNEDLAKLYSNMDLVLLTSWYESFPLPPIESMACGSVIITTQYGTEDYVFDNENGLVVFPRRIEDIAEKIIFAVENPDKCLEMVKNGLCTVEDYDWEKRTDILEEILLRAVDDYSFDQFGLFDALVKGNFDNYDDMFTTKFISKGKWRR